MRSKSEDFKPLSEAIEFVPEDIKPVPEDIYMPYEDIKAPADGIRQLNNHSAAVQVTDKAFNTVVNLVVFVLLIKITD